MKKGLEFFITIFFYILTFTDKQNSRKHKSEEYKACNVSMKMSEVPRKSQRQEICLQVITTGNIPKCCFTTIQRRYQRESNTILQV